MGGKKLFLIFLIIFLAFFLRLYRVTEHPVGFFADEAAIGYNAYKLLTTGKDEHGKSWPVFFQSFGEYRIPIPIYSNIPSILLFGLSEFSVRFTSALYGVLLVAVIFFLGEYLGGSRVGLLCAFLLAISPWHIHLSRWGAEYASFPFFFCLGLLFFLEALKYVRFLIPSFILFGLGLYTYYTSWVVTPLFLGAISVYWFWKKHFRYFSLFVLGSILFFIIATPLFIGIINGSMLSRWKHVNYADVPIEKKLKKYPKLYVDHFDVKYLFLTGDLAYPGHFIMRQFVKGRGVFYLWQAPLILIGVLSAVFTKTKRKGWIFVFILLFIYPLGTVLTVEGPSTTRSIMGMIPFILLAGFGLEKLMDFLRKRIASLNIIFIILLVLFVSYSVSMYLWHYYKVYPTYSADFWGWQYGIKDILAYYIRIGDRYDELYFAGEFNGGKIFLPFYTLDKKRGCKNCFGGGIEHLDLKKKQLFAASPGLLERWRNPHYRVIHQFYYPNGSVAFQIVQYEKIVEKEKN